jgi:hypothetical protein
MSVQYCTVMFCLRRAYCQLGQKQRALPSSSNRSILPKAVFTYGMDVLLVSHRGMVRRNGYWLRSGWTDSSSASPRPRNLRRTRHCRPHGLPQAFISSSNRTGGLLAKSVKWWQEFCRQARAHYYVDLQRFQVYRRNARAQMARRTPTGNSNQSARKTFFRRATS